MQIDKNTLETFLISEWGSTVRLYEHPHELNKIINFRNLTDDAIILLIDIYLKDSGSNGSGFSVHDDTYELINIVRNKLYQIKNPSRRLAPILRCYDLICDHSMRNEGEGLDSLATMYLIAEIEYYMKSRNKYTNDEGVIIREIPKQVKIIDRNGKPKRLKEVNQFKYLIPIYVYRNVNGFAGYLKNYDRGLEKYWKIKLKGKYSSINTVTGEKINAEFITQPLNEKISDERNAIMHGRKAPGGGKLIFQSILIHSIMYLYNQTMYNDISIPPIHDLGVSQSERHYRL